MALSKIHVIKLMDSMGQEFGHSTEDWLISDLPCLGPQMGRWECLESSAGSRPYTASQTQMLGSSALSASVACPWDPPSLSALRHSSEEPWPFKDLISEILPHSLGGRSQRVTQVREGGMWTPEKTEV